MIRLNIDTLKQATTDLNVRSDKTLRAKNTRTDKRAETNFTWYGKFQDLAGEAIFVVHGDKVTGTIRTADELYQIRPLGGGYHALIKVDETKFPEDHPPSYKEKERRKQPPAPPATPPGPADSSADSDRTIEVLVAYTPAAKAATTDIESLIELAVAETNQSYQNSRITAQLHLAHTYQVNYSETGRDYDTILGHFAGKSDGFMDEVHQTRDTHHADVAVLIINQTDYCGLADDTFGPTPTPHSPWSTTDVPRATIPSVTRSAICKARNTTRKSTPPTPPSPTDTDFFTEATGARSWDTTVRPVAPAFSTGPIRMSH